MRICILGGSPQQWGGLESYCDRAHRALAPFSPVWLPSQTAYMRLSRLKDVGRSLRQLQILQRDGLDVVWLQLSNLPDLVYLLWARLLRLPVIVTPHFGSNSRLQTKPLRRGLIKTLLRQADALGLLFAGQEREIELPAGPKRHVVGTFLPQASLSLTAGSDGAVLTLLHAARFSREKGSFLTVDLCRALADRGIAFSARLVGRADAETMRALADAIADAGLGDRITIIDWLGEEELQSALRQTDVLVHLSLLDAYPLIVLEALAGGAVPIVCPMAGAVSMVDRYGGRVVEGHDPARDAADWLASLSLDDLRAQGRRAAVAVRADYDWAVCAQQVVDIATTVLADLRTPAAPPGD
ncbi:glycosyltransferase [Altererythrobacter xixiisoli]|uniref:Glycosyltransferase n=1 Tax=Croceibacterium xixiisoli TaxID=1476466 RepID=A0A6I4TWH1_9SPHN|nr:glycosyltransferase family 4 protein [Croceibacterium xixiisoli]MXO99127.1 glycosyltransferase [Croceibacterium xixiisoli]